MILAHGSPSPFIILIGLLLALLEYAAYALIPIGVVWFVWRKIIRRKCK